MSFTETWFNDDSASKKDQYRYLSDQRMKNIRARFAMLGCLIPCLAQVSFTVSSMHLILILVTIVSNYVVTEVC